MDELTREDFCTYLRRGSSRTEMRHHLKMSESHLRTQLKDFSADEIFRWCQQVGRGESIADAQRKGDFVSAAHIQQSAYSSAALLGLRCWLDAQDAKDEESQHEGDQNVTG